MYPTTSRFQQLVLESHTALFKAKVMRANQVVRELVITGGDVAADLDQPVTRSMSISVADPDGDLAPESAQDLLAPYGTEIAIERGILVDGAEEMIPQGVFRLTGVAPKETDQGVEFALTGYDRAVRLENQLAKAYALTAGGTFEGAIQLLLLQKLPILRFRFPVTGFLVPNLVVTPDKQVWDEARRMAEACGYRLYFDRLGYCTMSPMESVAQSVAAWEFSESTGAQYSTLDEAAAFWNIDRELTSDGLVNRVTVTGTNSGTSGVYGEAVDSDPKSPTYIRGSYGEVVEAHQSELVTSSLQAQSMARGILAKELGASETITFDAVPHPALDLADQVAVTRERLGITGRRALIQSIRMPLTPDEPMSVTLRRSILTSQDTFQNVAVVDS